MATLPASPFLTDSMASHDSAMDDAAAPINSLAPGAAVDLLGSDISDVGEIFRFAELLCAQARIHPGTISPEAVAVAEEIKAYEQDYYDPPPLFLRQAGGWR